MLNPGFIHCRLPKRAHPSAKRTASRGLVRTTSLVLTLVFGAAVPALATTRSPHISNGKSTTPIEKGRAFYKGQTLTMLAAGAAGGAIDLPFRLLATAIGSYLHATVNVEDIVPGASIPEQDTLAASTPNGLTIGWINALSDASFVLTKTAGLNFNPAREAYLAEEDGSLDVLVAQPHTLANFAALKSSSSEISTLTETSGSVNTILRVMLGVLGVKANYISGYSSTTAETQGFARGDGQLVMLGLSNIGPLIAGGLAVPIAVTAKPPKGLAYAKYLAGVPTLAQLLATYPAKTKALANQYTALTALQSLLGVTIATQTSVAQDKVDALRAAFAWAFKQKSVQQSLLNIGDNPNSASPTTAKQLFIQALKIGPTVVQYMAQ